MRRKKEGAAQHAFHVHVVDERALAKHEPLGVLAGRLLPIRPLLVGLRQRLSAEPARRHLDGIENLHVPCTAAHVVVERLGICARVGSGCRSSRCFAATTIPGYAEAALQTSCYRERMGEDVPLVRVEALQCHDVLAGRLVAGTAQEESARPSTSTVQQPQEPCGAQPFFGEIQAGVFPQHLQQRHPVVHAPSVNGVP